MTEYNTTFKKHFIEVSREHDYEDWYITVTHPSGSYLYDGWWGGSSYKTVDEAIAEAKSGAGLARHKKDQPK